MLSDMLKPKMFAGLFGAAPSVATASLLVHGLAAGPAKDEKYDTGMLIGIKFGPVVGGLGLGFPAILPASLTLIEKKEGKEEASIDSLGAILGAVALVAFAVVVSMWVTKWGVAASVIVALLVWVAVGAALYGLVAAVYRREPAPP